MLKPFRVFVLCAAAVALSGCSSVPISSIYKLSRIDFMSTDLSQFRFALNMPINIRPLPGGVHMDLAYTQGDKPEEKRVVKLEESLAAPDFVGLPVSQAGTKTYVYRLPPNEVVTLNRIRNDAIAAKARKEKGSLSLGVAATEFCANAKISREPLLVTTYVLSSENNEYVVLTRDVDLRKDATISASLDKLTLCKS
jgi:hypothetical protein